MSESGDVGLVQTPPGFVLSARLGDREPFELHAATRTDGSGQFRVAVVRELEATHVNIYSVAAKDVEAAGGADGVPRPKPEFCGVLTEGGSCQLTIVECVPADLRPLRAVLDDGAGESLVAVARGLLHALDIFHGTSRDLFHGGIDDTACVVSPGPSGDPSVAFDFLFTELARRSISGERVTRSITREMRRADRVAVAGLVQQFAARLSNQVGGGAEAYASNLDGIARRLAGEDSCELAGFIAEIDLWAPASEELGRPEASPDPGTAPAALRQEVGQSSSPTVASTVDTESRGAVIRVAEFFADRLVPMVQELQVGSLDPFREVESKLFGELAQDPPGAAEVLVKLVDQFEQARGDAAPSEADHKIVQAIAGQLHTLDVHVVPPEVVSVDPGDAVDDRAFASGFDFDVADALGCRLHGIRCSFSFCDDKPAVRMGSIQQVSKLGFVGYGRILREAEVVISLGPKPLGLESIENFLRQNPTHRLRPVLTELLQETIRNQAELLGGTGSVAAFEAKIAALLPQVFGGDEELASLREALIHLLEWARYSCIPTLDARRLEPAWQIELSQLTGHFSEAQSGTILSVESWGLARGDETIQPARFAISVGEEHPDLTALAGALESVPGQQVMEAALADVREFLLDRQKAKLLGLESRDEAAIQIAARLMNGLGEYGDAASISAWHDGARCVQRLLRLMVRGRSIALIPDPEVQALTDREVPVEAWEIEDEVSDHTLDAFQEARPSAYGWELDRDVQAKARGKLVRGNRYPAVEWLRTGEALLGVDVDVNWSLAREVAARWLLATPGDAAASRLQVIEIIGNMVDRVSRRLDELRRDGVLSDEVSAFAREWDDRVSLIMQLEFVPGLSTTSSDIEIASLFDEQSVEARDEVHHATVPKGHVVAISRRLCRDTDTGDCVQKARLLVSKGPYKVGMSLANAARDLSGQVPGQDARGLVQVADELEAGGGRARAETCLELIELVCRLASSSDRRELEQSIDQILGFASTYLDGFGLAMEIPPAEVRAEDLDGYDVEWRIGSSSAKSVRLLSPRVQGLDGAEVLRGRLSVVRHRCPAWFESLFLDEYWLAASPVRSWAEGVKERMLAGEAVPDDEQLLCEFIASTGEPEEPQERAELTAELVKLFAESDVAVLGAGDALESLTSQEVEIVQRREDRAPLDTPVEIVRVGVRVADRLLVPARVVASAGPGGAVAAVSEALARARECGSEDAPVPADLLKDIGETLADIGRCLAEQPDLCDDEKLIVQLISRVTESCAQFRSQACLENMSAVFAAGVDSLDEAGWSVVPPRIDQVDIDALGDAVSVKPICKSDELPWAEIVLKPAVQDAEGEVVQRGVVLVQNAEADELADHLSRLVCKMQEVESVGYVTRRLLGLLESVPGAPSKRKDRIAVEALNVMQEAVEKGDLSGKRYRELARDVKHRYLESRGWREMPLTTGDTVESVLRLVELDGGPATAGGGARISKVVRSGYAKEGYKAILQKAKVRVE